MLTISSEAVWSFALVGQVGGPNGARYSYRYESDYMFLLNDYPVIIIEICSLDNEADRFRMLLEGSLLVRVMNSIKRTGSFVTMAIYVTNEFVAKRYLNFQQTGRNQTCELLVPQYRIIAAHFFCRSDSSWITSTSGPSGTFKYFFEIHTSPSPSSRY